MSYRGQSKPRQGQATCPRTPCGLGQDPLPSYLLLTVGPGRQPTSLGAWESRSVHPEPALLAPARHSDPRVTCVLPRAGQPDDSNSVQRRQRALGRTRLGVAICGAGSRGQELDSFCKMLICSSHSVLTQVPEAQQAIHPHLPMEKLRPQEVECACAEPHSP